MTISHYLIVICGPTASGKTSLSIKIAQKFKTEILSADARQFYKEMNIGTAKTSAELLELVPHHFINTLSVEDEYSAGEFEKDALKKLGTLFKKNNVAVLVGGSGLFIKAICEGLDEFPEVNQRMRDELNRSLNEKGISFLQEELKKSDPAYYELVDKNNYRRLIRALEVCRATGKPYSEFRKSEKKERDFISIKIGLDPTRKKLYEQINERVDQMMKDGLLEEVKALLPYRNEQALQTVGYTELFDYLDQKISLPEAIEKIKQHSRQYAKRQMTWFRQDESIVWFDPCEEEKILSFAAAAIE